MSASKYAKHLSVKNTPQTEPISGKDMVENNAGGFVFLVDDWIRLDRFLCLGSDGGSYYVNEKKLTKDNAEVVLRCLKENGKKTVDRIVEISDSGRAPKNDPAIFALALAASFGDNDTKRYVSEVVNKVLRIGTHLFAFVSACEQFRGHGKSLNRILRNWYTSKNPKDLAYQTIKYQQRDGWSHGDVLRLCKPKSNRERKVIGKTTKGFPIYEYGPAKTLHDEIFYWAIHGWSDVGNDPHPKEEIQSIWAFEKMKRSTDKNEICRYIRDYNMPRECVPTQFLTEAVVWEALLEKMPLTAMIRNLATMTRVGLLAPMSVATKKVMQELTDGERLRKSRIHPVAVLAALLTYSAGRGERSDKTWNPVTQITDALDSAFYKSFGNVEETGKRYFLGIDVSGSMWGGSIAGVPGLSPGIGAAAMALVTAAVEKSWYMAAFNTQMVPFAPSPRQRLDDIAKTMQGLPWHLTDCAQPMLHAIQHKIPVDVFCIYTDNETYANPNCHPVQALQQYRQKMGINAKLVTIGMVSNGFSIADKDDPNQIDVVGFDTATPNVIADFAKG